MLTSLFYVTVEFHRFLHRGGARFFASSWMKCIVIEISLTFLSFGFFYSVRTLRFQKRTVFLHVGFLHVCSTALFSYCRTPEKRTKWALNRHIEYRFIAKYWLVSVVFWFTTSIFFRWAVLFRRAGKELSEFLFLNCFLLCLFAFIFRSFLKCYPL